MEGKGKDELISKVKVAMDTLKESMKGEDLEKSKLIPKLDQTVV